MTLTFSVCYRYDSSGTASSVTRGRTLSIPNDRCRSKCPQRRRWRLLLLPDDDDPLDPYRALLSWCPWGSHTIWLPSDFIPWRCSVMMIIIPLFRRQDDDDVALKKHHGNRISVLKNLPLIPGYYAASVVLLLLSLPWSSSCSFGQTCQKLPIRVTFRKMKK